MADPTLALHVNSLDLPAAISAGQALTQHDQQIGINNQTMQLNDQHIQENGITNASLAMDLKAKQQTQAGAIKTQIADQYAKLSDDAKREATNHLDLLNASARSVVAMKDGPEKVAAWNRELDRLLANGAITKEQYAGHKQAGPSDDVLNHVIDVTDMTRGAIGGGSGYGSSSAAALSPDMANLDPAARSEAANALAVASNPKASPQARDLAKATYQKITGTGAKGLTADAELQATRQYETSVMGTGPNGTPIKAPDAVAAARVQVKAFNAALAGGATYAEAKDQATQAGDRYNAASKRDSAGMSFGPPGGDQGPALSPPTGGAPPAQASAGTAPALAPPGAGAPPPIARTAITSSPLPPPASAPAETAARALPPPGDNLTQGQGQTQSALTGGQQKFRQSVTDLQNGGGGNLMPGQSSMDRVYGREPSAAPSISAPGSGPGGVMVPPNASKADRQRAAPPPAPQNVDQGQWASDWKQAVLDPTQDQMKRLPKGTPVRYMRDGREFMGYKKD